MLKSILTVSTACAVLTVAAPVFAQDLSPEEIEEFQRLMSEGAEAYSAREYEKSIELLQKAQAIYDHPDLVYNIGRAYTRLRRCSDARRAFITYLQRPEITKEDDEKARTNLEELSECVTPARLTVTCEPAEASVSVDGEERGSCPIELEVEPGDHLIAVTASDHRPFEERRSAGEGDEVAVDVRLEPLSVAPVESPDEPPRRDGAWRPIVGWTAIGVGAAAIGTGLVVDSSSIGRSAAIRDAADEGDEGTVQLLERRARTARAASVALYVGGAVAAITGGVLVIWGSDDPDNGPTAGATVTLRF